MSSIRPCRTFATAAMLGIAACSSDAPAGDRAAADSTAGIGQPVVSAANTSAATDAGTNGLWTAGSLEKRLDLQGMAPRRLPDPVQHPFLSVPGTAYRLGNAELQVFIYRDADALARDVSRLDTVTVSPASTPVAWPARPTLITNTNLAAILLSENALQIERVQRALMAGTGSTMFGPATPPR
jgi:hypothetical protein